VAEAVQQRLALGIGSAVNPLQAFGQWKWTMRKDFCASMRYYCYISASAAFMINLFERNILEIFLRIIWKCAARLHVAIAELYPSLGEDLPRIEDEHDQNRGVRIIAEFTFTKLTYAFNMILSGCARAKVQTDRLMRVLSIAYYGLSSHILLAQVLRVIARAKISI
jgi:hypothetical protein